MRKTLILVMLALSTAVTAPVSSQNQPMTFFVSSTGSGSGGNLGGLAGADKHCQALAAKAGAGKSHVAGVSQHKQPGRPCSRLNRKRTLAQCQGSPYRIERRGAPLGQGQHQQRHRARRAGPRDQPAGRAQPARHPDGLHARWQGDDDDLPELDEQRQRGQRDAGASRSPHVRQAWIALELGTSVEGLLAGESRGDRGSRPGLLLRGQVMLRQVGRTMRSAEPRRAAGRTPTTRRRTLKTTRQSRPDARPRTPRCRPPRRPA